MRLNQFCSRFALALSRSAIGKIITKWIFAYMSWAIPVNRLLETDTLQVFHHPKPSYPVHILIVPKVSISSLGKVSNGDSHLLMEIISTVQILVTDLGLEEKGYRLIVNGGKYQDIAQLHFHLVSGEC